MTHIAGLSMSEPEKQMREALTAAGYEPVESFHIDSDWSEHGAAIGRPVTGRGMWAFVRWDRDGTCDHCYGEYEPREIMYEEEAVVRRWLSMERP